MKHSRLALVFAGFALGLLVSAHAAVETYDIDPVHTWVGFTVRHFFTQVPGFFSKVKGAVVVDRDHLENSTVEAVIEVASITTNTRMRDDDLRSANFFAAPKFPAMIFKSKAWKTPAATPTPSRAISRSRAWRRKSCSRSRRWALARA